MFPLGPIIALVLCAVVIVGQGFAYINSDGIDWMSIISAYIGIPLFLILLFGYKFKKKTKILKLDDVDLEVVNSKEKAFEEVEKLELEEN